LSDPEFIEMPGVGTLEAFLTDGCRTLLRATGVREIVEKTMRYPGYREKIELLRDTGFLQAEAIAVNGTTISPRALTAKLLIQAWAMKPGIEDLTAMRITASGVDENGLPTQRCWDLLDRYDRATATTSMARTTGYTCTAGVRLLASNRWTHLGVAPPELVGEDPKSYDFIMKELAKRNVLFRPSEG
jgi:lysine 6-dehydrogenase